LLGIKYRLENRLESERFAHFVQPHGLLEVAGGPTGLPKGEKRPADVIGNAETLP
jgi:hypothetical protein